MSVWTRIDAESKLFRPREVREKTRMQVGVSIVRNSISGGRKAVPARPTGYHKAMKPLDRYLLCVKLERDAARKASARQRVGLAGVFAP